MNNKTITITVEVDGNSIDRSYKLSDTVLKNWNDVIESILDTINKSTEKEF